MAVGTAALILILSVYNGFDSIIKSNLSDLDPDLLITRLDGSRFNPASLNIDLNTFSYSPVLEENVFLMYDGKQAVAKAKGVDSLFEVQSGLSKHILAGKFELYFGELPQTIVGSELANSLGVNLKRSQKIRFFYPKTTGLPRSTDLAMTDISGSSKTMTTTSLLKTEHSEPSLRATAKQSPKTIFEIYQSLNSISILPIGLFSISSDIDKELIIIPIEKMRELLGCENEVSGIELRFEQKPSKKYIAELSQQLGDDYLVRTTEMLNSSLYKMMKYEKLALYAILLFIIIIIGLNIYSSLSMLIIEKKEDIFQLQAMGSSTSHIKKIFALEAWLGALLGIVSGLIIGILLAYIQEKFGFIKMPSGFFISAYPCEVQIIDIIWTFIATCATALLISLGSLRLISKG